MNVSRLVPSISRTLSRFSNFSSIRSCSSSNISSNQIRCLLSNDRRCYSSGDSKRIPKIYTKTGDAGRTALFTGERRSKGDVAFTALGNVDELSCHIGLCVEFCREQKEQMKSDQVRVDDMISQLYRIQCLLQDVGSALATPKSSARDAHLARVDFSPVHIKNLESWIDSWTSDLPPLTKFILPSGGKAASNLHLARAACRRAERSVVPLLEKAEVEEAPYKFLNRLSDYLFTVARWMSQSGGYEEEIYLRVSEKDGQVS